MDDIINTSLVVYLVGTFLVIAFAARFFNNPTYSPDDKYIRDVLDQDPKMFPALPKYVTEKTRYHIYLGSFIVVTVMLYYFISLIFPMLISDLTGNEGDVTEFSVALVVGTLAFITLSTKIPYIEKVLTEWKESLHRRAQIPDKAMYVFDSMRFSELNKSSVQFRKNLENILNTGIGNETRSDIEKDYFYFDKDRIERKWARVVYLMYVIEQWSEDRRFERHLKTESLKWLALRSYYMDKLIPLMQQYRQGVLNDNEIRTTKKCIDILLIKVYWLITLLLFMANRTAEDPCTHLKQIGWIVNTDKYFKFSGRQIIFSGSMIFISILVSTAFSALILLGMAEANTSVFKITPDMIIRWLSFGVPMFVIPMMITMFAKRILSINGIWVIQRPEDPAMPFPERPWEIYLLVNLASYIATFVIIFTLYYLWPPPPETAPVNPTLHIAVYCGLALITSSFICYMIDTPTSGWEAKRHFHLDSLLPAIFQGTLNLLFVTLAFLSLNDGGSFSLLSLKPEQLGKLIVYDVIVFVAGISMYLTSRIGAKHYERRESELARSTEGWWTISIDTITKRVETMVLSGNLMGLIIDDEELRSVANVGDKVEFYDRNNVAMTGSIEEIDDNVIRISLVA
jgi:hypothetical protein